MTRVLDLISDDPRAARPRHPEKVHRPDQPVLPKTAWIRVGHPTTPATISHAYAPLALHTMDPI
jgi:lipoyl synthase